ncbi:retrovirus-related pol polyprotein from transposon TNT 1-94 [Tanacetum coccineum]
MMVQRKTHSSGIILGEPQAGVTTRSRVRDSELASAHECLYVNFLLEVEPKKLVEALREEGWIIAMQEELNQFERSKQKEGIDSDEKFAPVARLEAIRIFLAYAAYMGFMVYQLDLKSAFLNRKLSKEVYVQQPHVFESSEFPNYVYVDDIIFGSTNDKLSKQFAKLMTKKNYVKDLLKKYDLADCALVKCLMLPPNTLGPDESGVSVNETQFRGMIGSLMYLTASRPDIYFSICLCARYLKGTPNLGLWYPKGLGFNLKAYSDSDYAVAMSSSEVEYVAAVGCCAQVLWMKIQLADYDILYDKVPIFCDNKSVIAISNNPVLHSRTKHIDIRYHFIREYILKGDIKLYFVPTNLQLVDIFTKPLAEPSFTRLVAELGMLNIEKVIPDKEKVLSDSLT